MSSDEDTKNIKATFIIEVAGRPPEHISDALKKIVGALEKEKGVKIKDKKFNKPSPMKNQKDFYTAFAEIELEVEEVIQIVMLMFKYMPAHVDIMSPEKLHLSNNTLNGVLNELVRRLHGYDEVARVVQAEKRILENKLKAILSKIKEAQEKQSKKKEEKKE